MTDQDHVNEISKRLKPLQDAIDLAYSHGLAIEISIWKSQEVVDARTKPTIAVDVSRPLKASR